MMRTILSACKQAQTPLLDISGLNMELFNPRRRKEKVVFVIGATGTGKSKLSIDLATRFPSEIINSDKMQVYKGLHIVTNKVTEEECRGVPHHLLGIADPNTNFTAMDFCHHASLAIQSITARNRHPIIAGGSNSFIEALVTDVPEFKSRYECCFLWVDVSLPVLHRFVSERVDRMVEAGLVEEVRRIFDPEADYSRGIRRAIGVPEMDQFLRGERIVGDKIAAQTSGMEIHRLDATEAFLKRGDDAEEAWEKHVAGPSMDIVGCFLRHQDCVPNIVVPVPVPSTAIIGSTVPMTAVAAASH
ncbi:Adenylate isopentenyltransferase 5, chloroplastic [Vitis vinifera]|uniref:Adenylate isopentenyltransferase 5, chloroplastic n=1 Tax=Vitis vinifera TaxID=29760 RepID=A0A438F689_VITVI|nr:Adenylate isopentenyltransferase 5, chloroplastic [Vitis vinifera]